MNGLSAICLTSQTINGYLCPLSPPRRMERDQTLPAQHRSREFSSPHSAAERLNERGSVSTLARLARSTRGRIGAALLALVGTGATTNEADAATIMMQGEIIPASEEMEQPEYALALRNDDVFYSIGHADGTANAMMTWFGVERDDDEVVLDVALDNGSDVPNILVSPDQEVDDRLWRRFLAVADVEELQTLRYGIGPLFANGNTANLHNFLKNSRVAAGFGPLTGEGMPETLDEAIARTNGPAMVGYYSGNVELDDAWIFRSVHEESNTPEPSTLGLAGAALAAGLASRRRLKKVVREQG